MGDTKLSEMEMGKHVVQLTAAAAALDAAPRMQIVYQNLTYTVKVPDKEAKGFRKTLVDKTILHGISGFVQPARLTIVMGASGAGKTTFLNVLAGFSNLGAQNNGTITVNGEVVTGDKMRNISGFVHQDDVIMDTMTVREVLTFSAVLRLPRKMPAADKEARALAVADLLNLTKQLDNVVGSSLIKGISGGEKRRLALGVEMITNPSILYLDEPTSGLDTYTAYKVMKILHSLAHSHARTVVCTIHQPSSEIFQLFDDLLLLADGKVLYDGPAQKVVDYFGRLGYECPRYTNPSDYIFMDVLHAGDKQTDGEFEFGADKDAQAVIASNKRALEEQRIRDLLDAWKGAPENGRLKMSLSNRSLMITSGISQRAIQQQAAFTTQLRLLARRALNNNLRNNLIWKGKLAQTIFLSIIVGLIFLRVGSDLAGVQGRLGSMFFLVVQGLFGSVLGVLSIFGAEKAVFQREYGSRLYGLPAYFISRWAVNVPAQVALPILSSVICYWMVGYQNAGDKFLWFALILVLMDCAGAALGIFVSCCFNDIAVALAVMPMALLPLMVFSGFFVNSNAIPVYFNWIQYISPMRYGFIALSQNEFSGLELHCAPDDNCQPGFNGYTVLHQYGFDTKGNVGENAGILFAMMWGLLIMAYIMLWRAVRNLRS